MLHGSLCLMTILATSLDCSDLISTLWLLEFMFALGVINELLRGEEALAQLCPANAFQLGLDNFTGKACKSQRSELRPSGSVPKSTKQKLFRSYL